MDTIINLKRILLPLLVGMYMAWAPAGAGATGIYGPSFTVYLMPTNISSTQVVNHVKVNSTGFTRVPVNASVTVSTTYNLPYDHPVDIYMGVLEPAMAGLQTFQFLDEPHSYGKLVRNWLPILTNYNLPLGASIIPQGHWDLLPNAPRGLYTMFVVLVNSGDDASDTTKWITNAARFLMVE